MANTEGLSDEAVESLLSLDSNDTQKSRKSLIERRMEMPLGDRPAATVKRSSRRPAVATVVEPSKPLLGEETAENGKMIAQNDDLTFPVVGSIVERPVQVRRPNEHRKEAKKKSQFAQRQQLLAPPSAGGFPSVNVPIGTFVKPKTRVPRKRPESLEKALQSPEAGDSLDSALRQASAKDSHAMLEGMSVAEIQESIQELESALSPDTISFLKQRGKAKSEKAVDSRQTHSRAEMRNDKKPKEVVEDDHEEKERMSKLLSSIKTYDDLDAAHAAQMGDALGEEDREKDDFEVACDLLRSTVPRQNLWAARVVCHSLRDDLSARKLCSLGKNPNSPWPYPTLLPVSLRCLLDTSFSRVNGFVLHTYVLQSLYYLLQLRSCIDHVVDVTCTIETAASIYQQFFLDDAVPTPPSTLYYSSGPVQTLNVGDNTNVAYATSSSSMSAQADSEAFIKDPMWTLLSRMRMLPRLAQLVGNDIPASLLPKEAIVAICGILAMIGQRSPGAASAIVQHPSLLKDLMERALEPQDGSSRCDPDVALPTIILLCTLARQSRVAASGLDVDLVLLQILAKKLDDEAEFRLQRWALILWRTLLRYGLGLFPLSTMLTIAAPHVALGPKQLYSLAPGFYASFACVLRCIWVSRRSGEIGNAISDEHRGLLASVGVWLSSSARTALTHLDMDAEDEDALEGINRTTKVQFGASCLRFLESFWVISSEVPHDRQSGEFKAEELTMAEDVMCINALRSLLQNETLQLSLEVVLPFAFMTDFDTAACELGNDLSLEAAASAFLCSYIALLMLMRDRLMSPSLEDSFGMKALFESLEEAVAGTLVNGLVGASLQSKSTRTVNRSSLHQARRGWLNRAHASVVNFLGTIRKFTDDAIVRSLAYTVIGRLEFGEEATATVLLSQDPLFRPRDRLWHTESALSSMLVRGLCGTAAARQQLNHSFQLQHGLGMTSEGKGPFDMQTLLSQADDSGVKNALSDSLLPVGELWLWQCLSGSSVRDGSNAVEVDDSDEASSILMTSLAIICEQEDDGKKEGSCYTDQLRTGAKLYYLMNLCFQSGSILENGRIVSVAGKLLRDYTSDVQAECVSAFIQACRLHSSKKVVASDSAADASELSADEKKIASILEADPQPDPRFSKAGLCSLDDFVGDLCTAFIDCGAQYPFCTRCIRLFLWPAFPTKIRCGILRRLRGLLHLLTLEEDDNRLLLSQYLSSPTDLLVDSARDDPEFLDALVSTCSSDSRACSGFFFLLAVSALSKSLAIGLVSGSSALASSRRRLLSLDPDMSRQVAKSVAKFVSTKGTVLDLVDSVLEASSAQYEDLLSSEFGTSHLGMENWDLLVESLKSRIEPASK